MDSFPRPVSGGWVGDTGMSHKGWVGGGAMPHRGWIRGMVLELAHSLRRRRPWHTLLSRGCRWLRQALIESLHRHGWNSCREPHSCESQASLQCSDWSSTVRRSHRAWLRGRWGFAVARGSATARHLAGASDRRHFTAARGRHGSAAKRHLAAVVHSLTAAGRSLRSFY